MVGSPSPLPLFHSLRGSVSTELAFSMVVVAIVALAISLGWPDSPPKQDDPVETLRRKNDALERRLKALQDKPDHYGYYQDNP